VIFLAEIFTRFDSSTECVFGLDREGDIVLDDVLYRARIIEWVCGTEQVKSGFVVVPCIAVPGTPLVH